MADHEFRQILLGGAFCDRPAGRYNHCHGCSDKLSDSLKSKIAVYVERHRSALGAHRNDQWNLRHVRHPFHPAWSHCGLYRLARHGCRRLSGGRRESGGGAGDDMQRQMMLQQMALAQAQARARLAAIVAEKAQVLDLAEVADTD